MSSFSIASFSSIHSSRMRPAKFSFTYSRMKRVGVAIRTAFPSTPSRMSGLSQLR